MPDHANKADTLRYRRLERTEDDLARFKQAFEREGAPRSEQNLRWLYFDNPASRINIEVAVATDESRIAAIVSLLPLLMRVGGTVVHACQAIDTLTDSDYRGRGLFAKVGKVALERSQAEGYACAWGFPNAAAAHGWFERLGWTKMDPVPFLFKPLLLNYGIRRVPSLASLDSRLPRIPLAFPREPHLPQNQELRRLVAFDDEFSQLWERFAASIPIAVHRDARYLTWRLLRKPSERYSSLGLYEDGALRGFVSWVAKNKHGGQTGYVMELMHEPERPEVGKALLAQALVEMARGGVEVVLAWNFAHSPNHEAYRSAGFWELPERLRPVELHFGARSLAAPQRANICNRRNWYLSYLDSDTV